MISLFEPDHLSLKIQSVRIELSPHPRPFSQKEKGDILKLDLDVKCFFQSEPSFIQGLADNHAVDAATTDIP